MKSTLILVLFSIGTSLANAKGSFSFEDDKIRRPARLLYDLITAPVKTTEKASGFESEGKFYGLIEKQVSTRLSCSLYGKTEAIPKSEAEIENALCQFKDTDYTMYFGSGAELSYLTVRKDAAQDVYDTLVKVDSTRTYKGRDNHPWVATRKSAHQNTDVFIQCSRYAPEKGATAANTNHECKFVFGPHVVSENITEE